MRAAIHGAALAALLLGAPAVAQDPAQTPGIGPVTKQPMPRYVSLRSDEINVRRGPGLEYRRDWVFRKAGLPVRVVDEYGDWRRIVDSDGVGGWVWHALLTGRRSALVVVAGVAMRREPMEPAPMTDCRDRAEMPPGALACAEQGVVARLLSCRPDWCEITVEGATGWVPKAAIWGVEPDEVFDR